VTKRTALDWLDAYTATYYYSPSQALWRALEAQTLGSEPFQGPSLDVGAFDGSFAAAWLGDRPAFDVGVDLHPKRTSYTDRAYRLLVSGDAERLPFPDETFRFVLCNSVVEHIRDDVKAIREMARVLRPSGALLMSSPSVYFHESLHTVQTARRHGDEAAARAAMAAIDSRAAHYRYRSLEEWTKILTDAGLQVTRHAYCIPPGAAASWERWDHLLMTRLFGRRLDRFLVSRKLASVVPTTLWKNLFRPMLQPDYLHAVAQQADPESIGANLVIGAVRNQSGTSS
jgi:ubiquinone/menaquinone biosynthesis C-methylase UbiE